MAIAERIKGILTEVPDGTAPPWVREAFLNLVLPAAETPGMAHVTVGNPGRPKNALRVDIRDAVPALAEVNPAAAEFFDAAYRTKQSASFMFPEGTWRRA